MKLSDIAQVIRSKNAGPRRLTLDLMFANDADYHRVTQSPALSRESIGTLYGLTLDGLGEVSILVPQEYVEEARSILAAGEHGDLLLNDNDAADETE